VTSKTPTKENNIGRRSSGCSGMLIIDMRLESFRPRSR
jgi:hypothetical protein